MSGPNSSYANSLIIQETRSRATSLARNLPNTVPQQAPRKKSITEMPRNNMFHLPKLDSFNIHTFIPLKIHDNVKPLLYTLEHLKVCVQAALKKMRYNKPNKTIDREVLKDIFFNLGIFITPVQFEEVYIASMDDDDGEFDRVIIKGKTQLGKSKPKLNMSMDAKEKPRYVVFRLPKFVKWLSKNLHRMRNLDSSEIKAYEESKKPKNFFQEPEEEEFKVKLTAEQKKSILAKAARDEYYRDLRERIDKEESLRVKTVLPRAAEMGLGDQVYMLHPEFLVQKLQSHINSQDYEKDECVGDVMRLRKINRDIRNKSASVVHDANLERKGAIKAGNIRGTIMETYEKKLKEDESQCLKYSAIARARLRQRKFEHELKNNLEMSAILQEQETAVEAARLYELMYDDKTTKELRSFKKSLNMKEERRVRNLLNLNF